MEKLRAFGAECGVGVLLCRRKTSLGKQPTALHAARLVAAARIEAAERDENAVGRNIAVTTENATECAARNRQ